MSDSEGLFSFTVDEGNAEQLQKLLQVYLAANTAYSDSALPNFIMTMVQNGRSKAEVATVLEEFLGTGVTKTLAWITTELPKAYAEARNEDKVDFGQDEPAEETPHTDEEASTTVAVPERDSRNGGDDFNSRDRAQERRERFGGGRERDHRDMRDDRGRGRGGEFGRGRGRDREEMGRRERWNDGRERRDGGRGGGESERERREREREGGDWRSVQRRSDDRRGNNVSFTVRLDTSRGGDDDSEMSERLTGKRSATDRQEDDNDDSTVTFATSHGQPSKAPRPTTPKCSFWPYCTKGEACSFFHPSQPCTRFPNCRFGDKCLYIHPAAAAGAGSARAPRRFAAPPAAAPCRYGFSCHRRTSGCTFSHPTTPCRYGEGCMRKTTCKFGHGASCRYGLRCSRSGCSFSHGTTASVTSTPAQKESTSEADITALDASLPSTPPREGGEATDATSVSSSVAAEEKEIAPNVATAEAKGNSGPAVEEKASDATAAEAPAQ